MGRMGADKWEVCHVKANKYTSFAGEKVNGRGFLKLWAAWVGSENLPVFLFCLSA